MEGDKLEFMSMNKKQKWQIALAALFLILFIVWCLHIIACAIEIYNRVIRMNLWDSVGCDVVCEFR